MLPLALVLVAVVALERLLPALHDIFLRPYHPRLMLFAVIFCPLRRRKALKVGFLMVLVPFIVIELPVRVAQP